MNASQTVSLVLVAHTNVGKTTLARTLVARDVGEVRDAAHVTELAESHTLLRADSGETLVLWDTPGFGDSARLARRLAGRSQPIGWFLSEVWDRWRDRGFWSSQQALRALREHADVALYLVNTAEDTGAAYVAPELELLRWLDKPVLVLLNQLGPPRAPEIEHAERQRWADALAAEPRVRAVLPLDAFARCWVQEGKLWQAAAAALPEPQAAAMQRLQAAWWQARQATFDASMQALADGVAQAMRTRVAVEPGQPLHDAVRRLGSALGLGAGGPAASPAVDRARQALAAALERTVAESTARLIVLHGLEGRAGGVVIDRAEALMRLRERVGEGRAAVTAGLVSGALGGLTADLASGGLTLGGGMLAGALLGALGGAGAARGLNLVRGADATTVAFGEEAWEPLLAQALLRYLAVAHFGRGRGAWTEGEAPSHWPGLVDAALAEEAAALAALQRSGAATAASAVAALLGRTARRALERLYPGCWRDA